MSRKPKAAQAAGQEEAAAPDSAQVDDQEGDLVTVPLVIPATWRDELHSLAALRAAHRGRSYSRSALLRDILRPLMPGFRAELRAGHVNLDARKAPQQ